MPHGGEWAGLKPGASSQHGSPTWVAKTQIREPFPGDMLTGSRAGTSNVGCKHPKHCLNTAQVYTPEKVGECFGDSKMTLGISKCWNDCLWLKASEALGSFAYFLIFQVLRDGSKNSVSEAPAQNQSSQSPDCSEDLPLHVDTTHVRTTRIQGSCWLNIWEGSFKFWNNELTQSLWQPTGLLSRK